MKLFNSGKTVGLSVLAATLIAALSAFTIVSTVSALAEETETTAPVGITSINVSLSEDIIVKLHTSATTDDGSKVVVNYGGEDTEIAINANGVFNFAKVTPQNLNDSLTATMYSAEGAQIGESATFSVQSYLENLLALDYENSKCESELQYTAMKELAVNMLNYGAAAQEYSGHDEENLANKNLTEEQKALATAPITVSESDLAVSGDKWIGAGVRFDYKLGLYYVFQADSLDGITATVDGLEVEPEVYDASKNWYVIRYNAFTATNMNSVITAKLSQEGKEDQTFAYSVKSYVAAKGGDGTKLANLVNATYTYGYAAVAYSAEYTTVDATLESAGSITMDQKGYDFSGSKYGGVVTLPALNLTDYTAVTERGGSEVSPVATTTYTLISDTVNYTASVTSNSCVQIADEAGVHTVYSRYDYSLANNENQTLSWDEATGNYVYKAINPVIINGGASSVRSYGAQLVLIGDMTFNLTARLGANKGLIIGTETETANVLVNSTSTTYGIALWDGASLTVNKGSTLKVVGCTEDGIRGDKANTKIVIAGTVECANNLYSDSNSNIHVTSTGSLTLGKGLYLNNGANVTVDGTFVAGTYINVRSAGRLTVNGTAEAGTYVTVAGAAAEDSSYEYGFNPRLYIGGTLSVKGGELTTNSMQIGSEKNNISGTLNMHHSDNTCVVTNKNETRFVFAKGEVNITNSNTGKVGFDIRNAAATYIDIRSGFTFNKEKSGSLFGEWTTSNYHVSLQKGVIFNDISTISIGNKNVYLYGWDIQTVNIGGVEKQVKVTTVVAYTSKPSPYPNLSDTAFVALAEGATYTATGNTVSCGHLGTFNEATYTDADSITHTIYYQEIA